MAAGVTTQEMDPDLSQDIECPHCMAEISVEPTQEKYSLIKCWNCGMESEWDGTILIDVEGD